MFLKQLIIPLLLFCFVNAQAQNCTAPGQNPTTAFPVCGTNTFVQNVVPICGNRTMPTPCNDGSPYGDKNPFWYKFTCFTAGTLVFRITPHSLSDDYDWQLFDITNRNPNDVYTDASLFVCCNWSGTSGVTGTNLTATNATACSGSTPLFSKAPTLILGHEYLLLISHFSGGSQSGYDLTFTGGTTSITDTTAAKLQSAVPSCDGRQITVKLNKKMKCSSLASNGSDFGFLPAVPNTFTSVTGVGCSTGFDTDSIILTSQNPLPVGSYQLVAQNGSDANTLLDNCNAGIPVGNQVPFAIAPNQPTPFDSLAPFGCAPQKLRVVFRKPVLCSSITSDASDFTITGTQPVTITNIAGACNAAGETSSIELTLSQQLQTAGTYQLLLRRGTDGNTLLDICNQETPVNSTISFVVKDTVSATFSYTVFLDCKIDSIAYIHNGGNGITSWNWVFDDNRRSTIQNPTILYPVFGVKTAKLTVSNGVCTDSATATINLDNFLKANFGGPDVLCPQDSAVFTDSSQGKIKIWQWSFGNGITSANKQPPVQVYPPTILQTVYPITLVVEDSIGCRDSLTKKITVVNNCFIDVPTAFTPNGDGLNDYLYPLNAYKATNLQFKVYNRLGQLVWQTTDWTRKWDGKINGNEMATGAYVWFLSYTHIETGKKIQLQGTSVLVR
jgi:gliding motility-associated-like protein